MSYNGSAIIAMVGKNCVAIASDNRLGAQQQTLATDFQKTFKIHDRMFVGLSGLATDMLTLYDSPLHAYFLNSFISLAYHIVSQSISTHYFFSTWRESTTKRTVWICTRFHCACTCNDYVVKWIELRISFKQERCISWTFSTSCFVLHERSMDLFCDFGEKFPKSARLVAINTRNPLVGLILGGSTSQHAQLC